MSNLKYWVVVNVAAHDGHVAEVDLDKAWSGSNPDGWTEQEITGAVGSIHGEHLNYKDAEEELKDWLKCDSVELNSYCYTHNPLGGH